MSPKPKRLDWESVYHEKLFGINKSTSFLVAAFLLLVYLGFFVLVVLLGTPAQRVPLPVILGIRGVWLASAVVALWLISRDQIKSANNLILAIQILSALSHSLIVADTHSLLNFLGILLSCIIAFQISIILEKRRWFRIYYGFLLFLILLGRGLTLMFNQTTAVDPAVVDIVFLGNFIFLVIIFTGIVASVKRSRMEDIIIQVAYQDDLVDLPNQSSLMTRFNILNRLYWETGNAFALLGVYVDKMDRINYKYGYQAGNQIIKQVAQRLVSLDIPLDVYRIIGPIFVLAPGDFLNVLQVEALYPRIEEVMERPYSINGTQVNLDFSIVATRTPDDGVGINQLLMNILNVISRGNVAGNSHKVNWFDVHSFKQQLRQYEIEDQLEAGLNHDEFFINIQPKIDIRTGQVHGGEVLARWENSKIGFVSPAEFIPAVEATGRMPDFTRRIMEKIVDSKEMIMPVANANKFIIALNLNASTIQDELFINDLRRFIPRLAPFQIEIELTEDVFLVMDYKIIATLNSLKNAGAGIALDDFGTGFSNVSYLQELNVDTLKIDKRFISPLPGDNKALEIVRALISMAHAFSILVVAEGAETREQVELLKAEGCDIIQGFYFSKPLSVKDFVEYVSRGPESV